MTQIRTIAIAPVAILLLVTLAGCTGEPSARAVDFGGVDATQPMGTFHLHIRVMGLQDAKTHPIAGAFVGVANDGHAIAKSTTDPQGEATLLIKKDQTIRAVAQADQWTTEDSGNIRIGDAPEPSQKTCVGGGAMSGTASGGGASASGSMGGSWCVVDDSESTASYTLSGSDGSISIVLFPKSVEQSFKIALSPHANGYVVNLPDNKKWFPQNQPLSTDLDLNRLHMLRLVETHSTLKWTNSMLNQADLELGVGCTRDMTQKVTNNGPVPYFANQKETALTLDWNPTQQGSWSSCAGVWAGPVVDTLSGDMSTVATLTMVFKGRSLIIPVNA